MKFVFCVLLASLTKLVYCVNQPEAAQYQAQLDDLQKMYEEGVVKTLEKSEIELILSHIVLNGLSGSLNRLEEFVHENQNKTEKAIRELKANDTMIFDLMDRVKSIVNESNKNTERRISELFAKMETSNSRLIERIVELEKFATTVLKNQTSIEENNTRNESSTSFETQAKPPCLSTSMSAATNRKIVCEMRSFDGGWIVVQQRIDNDNNLDFNRSWTEYRDGFGTFAKDSEFWLGLEPMHLLTNGGNCELAVEMRERNSRKFKHARYSKFAVAGENDKYRLEVGGYSGTAGDQLEYHNNMKFTTYDSDNDIRDGNCAYKFNGWWHNACFKSNLHYPPGGKWDGFTHDVYILSYSRMMVRCE